MRRIWMLAAAGVTGVSAGAAVAGPGSPGPGGGLTGLWLDVDEEGEAVDEVILRPPPVLTTLEAGVLHSGDADFRSASGKLSVTRVEGRAGVGFALGERSRLSLGGSAENAWYDFSGADGFVEGTRDPFDEVRTVSLSVTLSHRRDDSFGWFVRGFGRSSGERGSKFSDTITFGGVAGGTWHAREDLSIGLGVMVTDRLEDGLFVIPFPRMEWRIDERWALTSAAAMGRLTYRASEKLLVGVEGGWEPREFRLDSDGPLPSGVVTEQRVPLGVIARWLPRENVWVEGTVGGYVYGKLEFKDSGGGRVSSSEIEPGLFVGLSAGIAF